MTAADEVARFMWYHTIELPGGIVTPGMFDTRSAARKVGMPASLAGKRCLDVGTSDGFWAFEMERRGAAEVVAVDLVDNSTADLTVGGKPFFRSELSRQSQTFSLAHKILGSQVRWQGLSVYDIDPALIGEFDFVFVGSLLMHLQDPIRALTAIRSVIAGDMLSFEPVSLLLSALHPRTPVTRVLALERSDWWFPNINTHDSWVRAAGFKVRDHGGIAFIRRRGQRRRINPRHPFQSGMLATLGVAQHWLMAVPD
jgi:tRNA (mo5U34)-methyltransferase